jgi:hypothetical protein
MLSSPQKYNQKASGAVLIESIPTNTHTMVWTLEILGNCLSLLNSFIMESYGEEPEELIRYAALIHNSVMTATSTSNGKRHAFVNDAFGMTSWLFQDVSDVTFIVFHRVVRQRHLLRQFSRQFLIVHVIFLYGKLVGMAYCQ